MTPLDLIPFILIGIVTVIISGWLMRLAMAVYLLHGRIAFVIWYGTLFLVYVVGWAWKPW